MKSLKILLASALLSGAVTAVQADTLTFDDIQKPAPNYAYYDWPLTSAYGGYLWNDFGVVHTGVYANSGHAVADPLGKQVLFSRTNNTSITREDQGLFDLTSISMTSSWLDNHQIKVTGWLNGNVVNEMTVTLQTTAAQKVDFGFLGVDKITFTSLGGNTLSRLNNFNSPQFLLNDVAVNAIAPVPEPSTYAMMLVGLGALGLMARRRKKA